MMHMPRETFWRFEQMPRVIELYTVWDLNVSVSTVLAITTIRSLSDLYTVAETFMVSNTVSDHDDLRQFNNKEKAPLLNL